MPNEGQCLIFVGQRIRYKGQSLRVDQEAFIDDLLKAEQLGNCKGSLVTGGDEEVPLPEENPDP